MFSISGSGLHVSFVDAENVTRGVRSSFGFCQWCGRRWRLRPVRFAVWMSWMFTLCVILAGHKTVLPACILSLVIFPSVCHCLSSCPSVPSLPFLTTVCPLPLIEPSPPPLSTSADAYHAPSLCVCRKWAPACQKRCILFIQSKHGPGCWMPGDSCTRTHTCWGLNHKSSFSILWCQWGAAGCHNEQSPHKRN